MHQRTIALLIAKARATAAAAAVVYSTITFVYIQYSQRFSPKDKIKSIYTYIYSVIRAREAVNLVVFATVVARCTFFKSSTEPYKKGLYIFQHITAGV